ncbi:MAG TPA: CARDB domain-containing protein [Candidatus Paceibacterota bacterium]
MIHLIKKQALVIVLVGLFVVVPSFGKAATTEELQAQINALLQQLQSLQQQLAQQQGGEGFYDGARVQALVSLRIRQAPSTGALVIGRAPVGLQGTIYRSCPPTSSPAPASATCSAVANGYTWWYIQWDSSVTGWSVEGTSEVDFMQLVTGTSPSITVLSPNGGETFQLGSIQPITWSVGSFGKTYRISVVDQNGFGQGNIATVTGIAADRQVYYWNVGQVKIPSDRGDILMTLNRGTYKILINEVETGGSDYSNAPFSIVAAPTTVSANPVGYVGPVSKNMIYGWACVPGMNDYLNISLSITPGIYQISNITANVSRTEAGFVQNSGCTNIYHGFAVNPSLNFPSLPAGTYTVTATAKHPTTGVVVGLTPLSGQTTFTVGAAVAPAPSLSSVYPNTVIALRPEAFNIYGFNFQSGATIVYSGPSSGTLAASFVNSTQLFLSVPGGLLQGTYTFKVRNPDGKESVMLIVNATAPTTASGVISSMTPNPCNVASGATRCRATIVWSATNAPSAGIRARDSVSGWEGIVCATGITTCVFDAAPGNYTVTLRSNVNYSSSQILDQKSGVVNAPSTSTGGTTSGADLQAVSISPAGPFTVGQSVTFNAVVKNAGSSAMPGSGYDADLMIDYGNDNSTCQGPGNTLSSGCNAYVGSPLSVPLIAPGATYTFSIPWTATCQIFTAPCTNLLRFRVDLPHNLMPESNESNNYITKLITVNPAGTSDASDLSNLASALNNIQVSVAAIAETLRLLLAPR